MNDTMNGHEPALTIARPRGRAAPAPPSIQLSSGHTVFVRRLRTDTAQLLRTQAYKELESERPTPPTQEVEVAPGETRAVERTADPDYLAQLEAWGARVTQLGGEKLIALLASYAILNETDQDAVDEYRAAMAAVGVEVDKDDRSIYCWDILVPTLDDQQRLINLVLNMSSPSAEAVQAHQQTFRGDVAGPAA